MNKKVLVTGGAGYIGSHTSIALLAEGYDVVIADNFCNSERWIPDRISQLSGRSVKCIELDLRDKDATAACLRDTAPHSVIHFGALKSVGESVDNPLFYYQNNITGTLNLLEAMLSTGCHRLVFSSSATVYGHAEHCPIREDAPRQAINPYGRTKLMMEEVIADVAQSTPAFRAAVLRYFNPAGAHPSGLLGELPKGAPNNLVPFVAQVAAGLHPKVRIFGSDYATCDGTGVRDYIHVMDLAAAHVCAVDHLEQHPQGITVNLGTGTGYSVMEIIQAFTLASGRPVPYEFVDRRPGDVDECYADPELALRVLGWEARYGLEQICKDAWRWQQNQTN